VVNAVAVLTSTVALVLGTIAGVAALRGGPQRENPLPYVEQPIQPKKRTVVGLPASPQHVTTGLGSVWVDAHQELIRVDPASDRVVARITAIGGSVPGRPSRIRYYFGMPGLTVGQGSVWLTGTRFTEAVGSTPDPRDTPTGAPDPEAAYAWSLLRIDPATNTWVAAMPAYSGSIVGTLPSAIVTTDDAVWAGGETPSLEGGAVYRIDTDTEEATTINVDGPVTGVAVLDGFVWATVDVNRKDARHVAKIDPRTNRIVQTIPIPGASVLQGLAASDGALWVPTIHEGGVGVFRIDASSGKIIAQISVRGPVTGIVAAKGAVWFSVQDDRHIFRISTTFNEVDGRLPVGGVPQDVAVEGSTVWVVADPDSEGGAKAPDLVRFDL
jgi:hypothetical protein